MKKTFIRMLLVIAISWGTVWGAVAMPIASTESSFLSGLNAWWHSIFG